MKLTHLFAGAAALAVAATAHADVTINITGATAFRAAAHQAILTSFTSVNYAFNAATLGSAGQAIFQGSFPGINGVTTIRTSWSGSVEGVRDLTAQANVNFLTPSAIVNNGANPNATTGTDPGKAQFGFSDVFQTSTPYLTPTLGGGPVGVVVFTMIGNEGIPITNITAQQFRAVIGNGFQPLSLFTGVSTDTARVFATGRNDFSGTRTTYLAETGYGIANPVQQYKVTAEDATTISTIRLWPANDGNNASTVWGNNVDGNGGYSSGGLVAGVLGKTSASASVLDAGGNPVFSAGQVYLVSWLGMSDAINAISNGAVGLGYDGVKITPANPLSNADRAKVTQGQYTAWGYEHLFFSGVLSADAQAFYNTLVAGMNATNLGASGIPLSEMSVGRTDDGGTVAP
jgi:hypothetical protein